MRPALGRSLAFASLLAACSYYDPSLLEGQPPVIDQGEGGESGDGGATAEGGAGGKPAAGGAVAAGSGGTAGESAGATGTGGDAGASGEAGNAGAAGSTAGGQSGTGGSAASGGGSGSSGASGSTSGAGGALACTHATYPNPPAVTNAGGNLDIVVVASSIDLGDAEKPGQGPSYLEIGYDLDLKCSCQGEPHSCKPRKPDVSGVCDGLDGRDNAAGAAVFAIGKISPGEFGSANWNNHTADGSTAIIRIRGYNGLADDDRVDVACYAPAPFDTKKTGARARFDGTDVWPVRTTTLDPTAPAAPDLDAPLYHDPNAYVTGGIVVASLPINGISLGNVTLNLAGAFITGKLVAPPTQGAPWRMTGGLLVGRWRTTDILSQAPRVKDPVMFKPLCKDNAIYSVFKNSVCDYADISSGPAGPTIPCDSLSLGIAFEAVESKLGEVIEVPAEAPICSPGNDPTGDTCD